jgi:hypothetical protein
MRFRILLSVPVAFVFVTSGVAQITPEKDPIKVLVGRLELGGYKETIRGLTKFGDRRQGTTVTATRSTGSKRN